MCRNNENRNVNIIILSVHKIICAILHHIVWKDLEGHDIVLFILPSHFYRNDVGIASPSQSDTVWTELSPILSDLP